MKKKTFEQALAGLEEAVRILEEGQLPLEQALDLFAEGITLAKHCHQQLENAEQRISILMADEKGNLFLKEAGDTIN